VKKKFEAQQKMRRAVGITIEEEKYIVSAQAKEKKKE
jgi:hypothetical protein